MKAFTATSFEKAVRALPCVVSGHPVVTLHHTKGASMRDLLGDAGNPGKGRKVSDFLVIPLHWRLHTGEFGIDNGMCWHGKDKRRWEEAFGTQVEHLKTVSRELGVNVFRLAGFDIDIEGVE